MRAVDARRVGVVGVSQGGWVTLSVAEARSFELIVNPSNLGFRAAVAFYPPCKGAGARPGIPTLILRGALDDWTPAEGCSRTVAGWGTGRPPPTWQNHVRLLAGIQRRGRQQCDAQDAGISRPTSPLGTGPAWRSTRDSDAQKELLGVQRVARRTSAARAKEPLPSIPPTVCH
jgi:hypothetical protein